MNLSEARDAATIIGVIIGVMTLLKGYLEYRRNAVLGRVQHFSTLKQEFKENAYWLLFFDFVARMRKVESSKEQNRSAFVEKIRA